MTTPTVHEIRAGDWSSRLRWAVYSLKAVPTGGPTLSLAGVVATFGPNQEA